MPKTIHCCISVRGLLRQSKRELQRVLKTITHDDGKPFHDVDELREALMDELSRGHEVLPLGACDNFDYKTGCKGHPTEEEDAGDRGRRVAGAGASADEAGSLGVEEAGGAGPEDAHGDPR